MALTLLSALVAFAAGVAAASDINPRRGLCGTLAPLVVALAFAAVVGAAR